MLGLAPLVLFFASGMYQSKIVEPALFVERLNRSLAQFHVAYSADAGRLLHTTPVRKSWRQPIFVRGAHGRGATNWSPPIR